MYREIVARPAPWISQTCKKRKVLCNDRMSNTRSVPHLSKEKIERKIYNDLARTVRKTLEDEARQNLLSYVGTGSGFE